MSRKATEVIERKSEDLSVDLKSEEIDAKARRMAERLTELDRYNDETKRIADDRATRRKLIESEVKKLRDAVNEKAELRPVVVEVWADWKNATIREIRQDTGAILRERAMEPSERQTSIEAVATSETNKSPKAIARQLFSDGVRPEDSGIEKLVEDAAKAGGAEIAAVLDALVELAEEADAKREEKEEGDGGEGGSAA